MLGKMFSFIGLSRNDGISDPTVGEVNRARHNAIMFSFALDRLRCAIDRREFPNRADAIAVVDMVTETLRQQHGGMYPNRFIEKVVFDSDFRCPSDPKQKIAMAKVLSRWGDRTRYDQEFGPMVYTVEESKVGNETVILEKVSFMREWLQNQRNGSQIARPHQD
jgi:hypothetical protein